jgi:hypothetical protein
MHFRSAERKPAGVDGLRERERERERKKKRRDLHLREIR